MSLAQNTAAPEDSKAPYRVMVVDDSAVIRGLLTRILESDPAINVVASASNGELALRLMPQFDLEVIVLDIEMPVMDGLQALPKLLAINPAVKVIMASTLTQRNAQISFKALAAGAADYIPKPMASRELSSGLDFQRDLRTKVQALGASYRGAAGAQTAKAPATSARPGVATGTTGSQAQPVKAAPGPIQLRKLPGKVAEIIAIGSSTGGPQALLALLKDMPDSIQVPVVITQHMPPMFTKILAEHISRAAGRPCAEAKDGDPVLPRHIYLAPGDWHMVVARDGNNKVFRLNQDPPVNFCRPAVDPLFESIAEVYDGRVLAVVLTGMGQDGLNGGRAIIEKGGVVAAQDEASSVVWGMPGAVATAGICHAVLPLKDLPQYIEKYPTKASQ